MAKKLVTYFSQTGNTKKIAEAIFESLEGDKEIRPADEVQEIEAYSLIFIGFPVHSHSVPFKIDSLLRKIPQGKKIAIFSTHGSLPGGRLAREALEHAVSIASKAKVLATFSCRGKVSMAALEVLSKSPEHKAWTEMAASGRTHPTEGDIEDARSFAKWVVTLGSHDEP
jgi:flavodoxin